MQQSEFEKSVREKMDELNFTPSPPVWPQIEKQIRQKKERRRLLAWFFLLALMLGGGTWWVVRERLSDDRQPVTEGRLGDNRQPITEGKVREKVEGSEVEGGGTENTGTTDRKEKNTVVKVKENEVKSRRNTGTETETETGTGTGRESVTGGSDGESRETMAKVPVVKRGVKKKTQPEGDAPLNTGRKNTKPAIEKVKQDKPAADSQAVVMTETRTETETETETGTETGTGTETETGTGTETERERETSEELQKEATAQEPSADTAVAVQSNNKQQKKTSKWSTGISVTVGVSGVGEGLRLFPTALRMENLYNSPNTGGSGGMTPLPPSRVGDGFSFGVGYVVKRNTGKALSYSGGLRYNYYSTTIAVGTRRPGNTVALNNGTGFVTADAIYSNARFSGSMDSTNIYTNQYHFVSLPFDLEVKLGKIPLYATAGLSLQYLVATNALVYSPDTYVYYQYKKALNSMQLFGNIGLHYTFFQNKKYPVQLGPQLSSGLGRLEKGSRSNLFAAGISARMMLGKKRI